MRILLVEDQESIRHMVETLVQASGHEVVGAPLGEKGVELALAEPFDCVLLDLMLPGSLDGFGVLEHLRANEKTRDVPVVVLSAMDDPDTQARVIKAGATAFFGKPFRPLELLNEIKRVTKG